MTKPKWRAWPSLLSLLLLLTGQAYAVDIIANVGAGIKSVSRLQCHTIFSGYNTHWQNDVEIRVVVMPENSKLHGAFTKKYLNLYPYQLRRIWDRQNYTGVRIPIVEVSSMQEMVKMVSTIPGAIGYIESGASIPKSVARIEINDRSIDLPFWGQADGPIAD